jgi:glutamyl-tRNA reductase
MTPEQEIAVEALTRGIINKVMHTPITTLKTAAKESEVTTVIDVVRRLFNLHDKETGPASQAGRGASSNKEALNKEALNREVPKKEAEPHH